MTDSGHGPVYGGRVQSNPPSGADPGAREPPDPHLRVFLVEDAPLLRSRLKDMVGHEHALEVVGDASGESEAIDKLRLASPDVVVVDLQLRPGSGIAVIRAARAAESRDHGARHIWIVVLTNLNLPAVRERCEAAGADFFLDKMQEIDRLIPMLRQIASHQD